MSTLALPWNATRPALPQDLRKKLANLRPLRYILELRIDVQQRPDNIETELEALHGRMATPGDPLHGVSRLPIRLPGFVFWHREADGEHYVYVEDIQRKRLAGYTVFNRLIEVNRRVDRFVRGPHSKYAPAYQRRGIATAVYQWALGEGFSLISGARQSEAAHALWHSLGRRYPLAYVALQSKEVHFLGFDISPALRDDLNTRMILFGRGCSLDQLRPSAPPRRRPHANAEMTRA